MSTGFVKNAVKQRALELAKASGGFALTRRVLPRHLRILAYHGLWTTAGFEFGDRLFINPDQFERRMTWLKKSRYPVLDLDTAICGLADGTLPENSVVITIDDGWKSTYTHMLPILEQLRLPATAYITTWYAKKESPVINVALNYVLQRSTVAGFTWRSPAGPELNVPLGGEENRQRGALKLDQMLHELPFAERLHQLREICGLAGVPTEPWWSEGQFHLMNREEIRLARSRGLSLQLHTHRHINVDAELGLLPGELCENRSFLAEACNSDDFHHFCYPNGRYHPQASEFLAAAGVRSAVLTQHGLNPPDADPFALRRFLDGRSVTQAEFEAYLCGALDLYATAAARLRSALPSVRPSGRWSLGRLRW
jgi:peptidoglycan/xylan/chitin deacetylase (PgdA/CDA1 family)